MNSALNGLNNDAEALYAKFKVIKDKIFGKCMNEDDDKIASQFDIMINIIKSYKELFEDIEKAKLLLKSIDARISIAEHQNRL